MKRYCLVVVLLFGSILIKAQGPVRDIRMSGVVVDAQSKEPLQGAHLVLNHSQGTTPDIEGKFDLNVSSGDTLMISHVGYNDYLVPIPHNLIGTTYFLRIGLIPATVELDEVTVYLWPATVAQFKQELLALEVEEEERVKIPGAYYGPPKPVNPGVGSPVSFLYNKLSKRARQRREFMKKRQDIESNQQARSRWNTEYVKEITGIEDEQVLLNFMEYCKFTDRKLGELNDYDLITAINDCFLNFKSNQ